jgi:Lrp/AsnC family transcriptional regulator of lysine biosynthesis
MDELDRKILDILEQDARTPFVEIGRQLKISEATVRNRVKSLLKSGQIRKFTIVQATKERTMAIVLVSTASKFTRQAAREIRKLENVEEVYEVSGDFDIICIAKANSVKELNKTVDSIRKIEGVMKTVTNLVLV